MPRPTKSSRLPIPDRDIVILGSFNPAIIQTSWLQRFKILPEHEIAAAEDILRTTQGESKERLTVTLRRFQISGGKTILVFESFLLNMTRERFQVSLRPRIDATPVLEGLQKMFTVLQHTPVSGVGFNYTGHWRTKNGLEQLRELFTGNTRLFKEAFGQTVSVGGRVRFRDSGAKVLLETEPSVRLDNGVYFNFNFHFDIPNNDANELVKLLPKFPRITERALHILYMLYGQPTMVLEGMEEVNPFENAH